jgi:hypothetical protein
MMALMPQSSFTRCLGIVAAAVLTGCGGGGSSTPAVQTTPPQVAIATGAPFVVSGSKGVTFTFGIGPGVPAGESVGITALPPAPPCVGTGCTAVQAPLDGFQLSVGPQPLALGAFASVALTGVQSPFLVSMTVQDTTDGSAFTNFALLPPTGGPITFSASPLVHPILTLAPNHTYAVALYSTGIPPS